MERILIIAVIVLPLVIFLALFAGNLMTTTSDVSDTASSEAQQLLDLVTQGN